MGRKCSVVNCKTGYASQTSDKKIPIYKFPDDNDGRRLWISCLPNQLDFSKVTKNMGVCALHWPADTPLVHLKGGRYPVPTVPPSIFPHVPKSCVPSHYSCTPRSTSKALSSARNTGIDELSLFKEKDLIKEETVYNKLKEQSMGYGILAEGENFVGLLSLNRTGPIHKFQIYFFFQKDSTCGFSIKYESFYKLKKITHPTLSNVIKYWSEVEELLRFVKDYSEEDKKLQFLCQATQRYNCPKNSNVYSLDDFSLAFTWYAMSRALYSELRNYIQLPSLSTLRKLTRVAKNKDDASLFSSVFSKLDARSRGCILIVDEVYVKASLTYRGGTIFGYAVDHPAKLATTFLCVMVKCFFGSKSFLVRLIPCHALKADFQFHVLQEVFTTLEGCGAQVVGIICDNNRMNQRFFGMFTKPDPSKPWIAKSPTPSSSPLFLIYDPVHLLKNIRNSWITERTQQMNFTLDGVNRCAQWSHLKALYEQDSRLLVRLTNLSKSAVSPNNLEKQKVSLALQVFSEKTSAALKSSEFNMDSWLDTAIFIDSVVQLWKVFNCKTSFQHIFQRDPDRTPVDLTERGSRPLTILQDWAEMAKKLQPFGTPRIGSLTLDTSKALHWTCKCLVDLSLYLLETDAPFLHKYVTLGFFQQDDIERHFAHFRMSAGNNYFITAQDIFNIHAMDKTKLMLETEEEIDFTYSNHSCDFCMKPLTDPELLLIDDLLGKAETISHDEKLSLLYIGGYICQKHKNSPHLQGHQSSFTDISNYTDTLNRGGLLFPSEQLFNLIALIFTFFKNSPEHSCRRRLVNIFFDFPSIFHLDLEMPPGSLVRIVNILFKKHCRQFEGITSQNKKRKLAKLTSTAV